MRKNNLVLVGCLIIALLGITELSAKSIGPQPIVPTSLSKGTIFAAPYGKGTSCLASSPCDIWSAINKAVAGDVVFLRGGTYLVNKHIIFSNRGSATAPIIFESYPNEIAVFDGVQVPKGVSVFFQVTGKFMQFRRIEVMRMPMQGIYVTGTDNIFDGVHVHHNALTGIHLLYNYTLPYGAYNSRNIIRNCTVHHNSGVGLPGSQFANGGNSDGISISSGTDNRIENCLIYSNSDDGVDTWRSINSYVGYNIIHSNGLGDGDGNGIKAGGPYPSASTFAEHNLSYSNTATGINYNLGRKVRFNNNTTWNNESGYFLGYDTTTSKNIASETWEKSGSGSELDNSWQRSSNVAFISTSTSSRDFLVPIDGFDDIGAHVNVTIGGNSVSSDVTVTQVSYASGIFKSVIKNQGTVATPAGVPIGVAYFVNGQYKTWGDFKGPLAAGQSVEIISRGGVYIIPTGTHTISAHVDDVNRFVEVNETNNKLSLQKTIAP